MSASRRKAYLQAMGITLWQLREPVAPGHDVDPSVTAVPDQPSLLDASVQVDLPTLARQVESCRRCPLGASRNRSVFGVGNTQPALMIIGEAPGVEEDRKGEPFVGRAGHLLDNMLRAMGLCRQQVYIANVVKCRPPGNRNPAAIELAACRDYLDRQIELLQPQVLLSLGAVSAHSLLGVDTPVGRLRGNRYRYGEREIPLLVTYHPAYLLRRPEEKAKVWSDLQELMAILG